MDRKVDFSCIEIKGIDGSNQKADIRQPLGNLLYMQGQNIEECELGAAIYHQKPKEPLDLTDDQAQIISRFAQHLPYVMRSGILSAVKL